MGSVGTPIIGRPRHQPRTDAPTPDPLCFGKNPSRPRQHTVGSRIVEILDQQGVRVFRSSRTSTPPTLDQPVGASCSLDLHVRGAGLARFQPGIGS